MPVTTPNTSEVNFTPSSVECGSPASGAGGLTAAPQIEHGHDTFTVIAGEGLPRLPLSSTARALMVVLGLPCAAHGYDQLTDAPAGELSVAGCQLAPLSVETSTPATTPPPLSVAVPEMLAWLPSCSASPCPGEAIVVLGASVSDDLPAALSPAISDPGCAPMSANRLTVACSMLGSGGLWLGSVVPIAQASVLSSPHDHCTVPA